MMEEVTDLELAQLVAKLQECCCHGDMTFAAQEAFLDAVFQVLDEIVVAKDAQLNVAKIVETVGCEECGEELYRELAIRYLVQRSSQATAPESFRKQIIQLFKKL